MIRRSAAVVRMEEVAVAVSTAASITTHTWHLGTICMAAVPVASNPVAMVCGATAPATAAATPAAVTRVMAAAPATTTVTPARAFWQGFRAAAAMAVAMRAIHRSPLVVLTVVVVAAISAVVAADSGALPVLVTPPVPAALAAVAA